MVEKHFKSRAPFGVATKRFIKIGFHPKLDVTGAMKREITKTGPGSYNPKFPKCINKVKASSWTRKKELEEFSKYLGYRNAHILAQRIFDRSLRGPGNYDINDESTRKHCFSIYENTGFGTGDRFKRTREDVSKPNPNRYFKHLNEEPFCKKSFSNLPTFEYDGIQDRFKSTIPPYKLPPNIYITNDKKNTCDITKKIISSRGPYDLFTGPRDGTTIKNHLNPIRSQVPDYFYVKPSDLDYMLYHPGKRRYGVFLQSNRFTSRPTVRHMLNDISLCYKDPDSPGPAHYYLNLDGIQCLKERPPPFGSYQANARPPTDWQIKPGPGRYSPKWPKCMKIKKASWVFSSKLPRTAHIKGYDDDYRLY